MNTISREWIKLPSDSAHWGVEIDSTKTYIATYYGENYRVELELKEALPIIIATLAGLEPPQKIIRCHITMENCKVTDLIQEVVPFVDDFGTLKLDCLSDEHALIILAEMSIILEALK